MIPGLLNEYIKTEFEYSMAEYWFACPGIVTGVSGDFSDLRVTVKPAINELYADGVSEEHLDILSVPVIMPGSATSLVSFPINAGDTVLLVFSQRSMDNFKIGNGQPTQPNDARKFQAEDAIAIPGLFTFAKSANRPSIRKYPHNPKTDLVVAHNIASGTEVMLHLKQSGDLVINTEQQVIVNCKTGVMNATESYTINTPTMNVNADNTTWTGDITHEGNTIHNGDYTQTGNYTLTGQATFNGVVFDTHFHSGVTPGTGNSGPVAG
jgi:hypothetical protein